MPSVSLIKGQKIDLTKTHPGLTTIRVGLGWDINPSGGAVFDLDASAFLLNASGKCIQEEDFIFYNNPIDPQEAVFYSGDNRVGSADAEQIWVDLTRVSDYVDKIVFAITIHEAVKRGQHFGQVSNAFVQVSDHVNEAELLRFDLGQEFSGETAIVASEIYRHKGDWKFNAIGKGFLGGLEALCQNFGVASTGKTKSRGQTKTISVKVPIQEYQQLTALAGLYQTTLPQLSLRFLREEAKKRDTEIQRIIKDRENIRQ